MTDPEKNPRPSRYGRRLEDLSDDERAYYREFLPPQAFTGEQGAGQASAPLESADAAHPARTGPGSQRGKRPRSRWYWLPHSLTIMAVILAVASFQSPCRTQDGIWGNCYCGWDAYRSKCD